MRIAVLIVPILVSCALAQTNDGKIIEWGWSTQTPLYVHDHINEMQKVPFDGLVLSLWANGHHDPSKKPDRVAAFHSGDWTPRARTRAEYSESIEALKTTKFGRFTDNFLRFSVVPGEMDWFDPRFNSVVANFKMLAEIAKESGFKGIMFDTEAYPPGTIFNYSAQKTAKDHPRAEYEKRVRQCGKQMMAAATEAYPDIKIIFTLAYWNARNEPEKYGLLTPFLDGMLEGADGKSILYDGFEFSYNYRTEKQFQDTRKMIREESLGWTAVPQKMKSNWQCSFGIWVDYDHKWDAKDFTKNFFTPEEFAYSVHQGLKHTDGYVWIWSEIPNWWNGTMPKEYIETLVKAKRADLPAPSSRSK